MKGPWESIAAGREKGFKTEKLEKVENHATKRVRSIGRMFMWVDGFQESEGCP